MNITPTMDLDQLAERIWVNGDHVDLDIAQRMRALLTLHAPAYGWATTSDVEDRDWFRMLNESQTVED
jgi:hypothetical protein